MENGHIVEQGDASCFTEPQTEAFKTISLTKIRDNNNEKVLIAALIAGFSLSATAAETIRFATEASYPPFESIDANNQIVGFDVDLAQALCKEIDATCTFSNQAFDSLIPSLKFRRVEAVMAGMDITPEREKQVLFTTRTMTTLPCLWVSKANTPVLIS